MKTEEPNSHFLVHWSYDEHHKIFGIFSSTEIAIQNIKDLKKGQEKDHIIQNYQIDEYKGNVWVDTIYVADMIDV